MPEVKIGEPFPDFKLETIDEKWVTVQELLKGKPTVLVFIVGEWSPYCQAQMTDLTFHKDEIEDKGSRILIISVDLPEKCASFKEQMGFDFDIYSDQRWAGFQLLDNKDDQDNLYKPSVYVMDAEGRVLWKYIGRHYGDRANFKEIVAALTKKPSGA